MGELKTALEKFGDDSTDEEILKGLQSGAYVEGLNTATEAPIFQNYLIAILNFRSSKKLAISLKNLGDTLEKASTASSESARVLNRWTGVLAFATIVLAIATIVQVFK